MMTAEIIPPVPLVVQIAAVRREIMRLDRVHERLRDSGKYDSAEEVLRDSIDMRAVLLTLHKLQSQEQPEAGFG